ncbi:MAG: twin-arginine translocase subunit TatC [Patescibacteria group bacterium]
MNPKKTFGEHLSEIRERLLFSFGIFLLGSFIGYIFYNQILNFLITPLHSPLYYSSPAGGFDFAIKICIFFGIAFSLPVFTYNFLRFIEPTILRKPRFFVLRFLIASLLLMTLGISFAYYVGLPAALHFLGKFGSGEIKSLILTNEYLNFVIRYLVGFGVLFQLPLVLLVINSISRLHPNRLMRLQKLVIVGSFSIAAIITPTPDFLNQTIMAVPIILIYQLSILLVWYVNRDISKAMQRFDKLIQNRLPIILENREAYTWYKTS